MPLAIEHGLNQAFASSLGNALIDRIFKDNLDGKISLEDLVQEDPVIEKKRKELAERKTRLLKIKEKLDGFSWVGASS